MVMWLELNGSSPSVFGAPRCGASTRMAEPVQRLTPQFHNIRIENVKSIHSDWAGVIVGLPESPVVDIVLKNVDIQARKGFQVGCATVDMHHVGFAPG